MSAKKRKVAGNVLSAFTSSDGGVNDSGSKKNIFASAAEDEDAMEDVRKSNMLYIRLINSDSCILMLCLLGVGSCVVGYEFDYYNQHMDRVEGMYYVSLICTLVAEVGLVFRYKALLQWKQERKFLTRHDTLYSSGLLNNLVREMALNIITPLPWISEQTWSEYNQNWSYNTVYKYNSVLLVVMILARTYLIIRWVLQLSFFTDPRSQRVCSLNGCEANQLFAMKALLKNKPYTVLSVTMVISAIQLGYCLRVFERPLSTVSGQDYNLFYNAIWNVIITMTTVGYGDFYPKSNPGRLIGIIIAFWGVFIVSLFVISLTNLLNIKGGELKAFELHQRLQAKEDLKKKAVDVLSAAFKLRSVQKHDGRESMDFRYQMIEFKKQMSVLRSLEDNESMTNIFW